MVDPQHPPVAPTPSPRAVKQERDIKQEDDQSGVDGLNFDHILSDGSNTLDKVKTFAATQSTITGHLPAKWLVPRPPDNYEKPPPIDRSEEVYEVSHIRDHHADAQQVFGKVEGVWTGG